MAKRPVLKTPPSGGRRTRGRSTGGYQQFNNSSVSIRPNCDGEPLPVKVESSCEEPLFVELCDSIGIEFGALEVGCIQDEDGNITGTVFICIIKDEDGATIGQEVKAFMFADSSVVPYDGPTTKCIEPQVDIKKYEYCNPETATKWLRVCQYKTINGTTEETIISDTDLGFPCIDAYVVEHDYCIK